MINIVFTSDLSNNDFYGTIPENIGELLSLSYL